MTVFWTYFGRSVDGLDIGHERLRVEDNPKFWMQAVGKVKMTGGAIL